MNVVNGSGGLGYDKIQRRRSNGGATAAAVLAASIHEPSLRPVVVSPVDAILPCFPKLKQNPIFYSYTLKSLSCD